jgi:hypothetical protein
LGAEFGLVSSERNELGVVFYYFLLYFCHYFSIEIRDLKRDDFTTLPMKIGIQNTKYLSYIFMFEFSSGDIFSEI